MCVCVVYRSFVRAARVVTPHAGLPYARVFSAQVDRVCVRVYKRDDSWCACGWRRRHRRQPLPTIPMLLGRVEAGVCARFVSVNDHYTT